MLEIGQKVSEFTAKLQDGSVFTLSQACQSHRLIMYFYPKDMTPGCTKQAEAFRDAYPMLLKHGIRVVGVSKDNAKSHEKFITKHDLPFDLIADTDKEVCEIFGCMVEKSRFGRKYLGIERSTFFIDQSMCLVNCWRNFKVPEHVDIVCREILSPSHET